MTTKQIELAIIAGDAELLHRELDAPLYTCQQNCSAFRNFKIAAKRAEEGKLLPPEIIERETEKILGNLVAILEKRTQSHGVEVGEYQSI